MGFLIAAAALCLSPQVHDGDSLRCGGERIRIANIDAPELPGSSKCRGKPPPWAWCDAAAGFRARDALRAFLASGPVLVERLGIDPYGRTLAQVSVRGADAGAWLVALGLARWWR